MKVVAAITGFLIVSALTVLWFVVDVCEKQVPAVGTDPTPVDVCRKMTITDPPVVAAAVVLLALAGAFYNEVSGFGVTLKRSVDDAKEAAEGAGAKAEAVAERVGQVEQTLNTQISDVKNSISNEVKSLQLTASTQMSRIESSVRASQNVSHRAEFNPIFNLGPAVSAPENVRSHSDLGQDPVTSSALESIRAALSDSIRRAFDRAALLRAEPVRVAIVGQSPGTALMRFPAFAPSIVEPFIGIGAALEPASMSVGAAELGIVLAMEPTARIQPFVALDEHNQTSNERLAQVLAAAVGSRPNVLMVNLALFDRSRDIADLLTAASRSAFVVAAAGNNDGGPPSFPADVQAVTAVGSVTDDDQPTPYSSAGSQVDLFARGDHVLSLVGIDEEGEPRLGAMSGTSQSAAIAAGVGAMLLARTDLAPPQVRAWLRSTAREVGELRILDAQRALEKAEHEGRTNSSGA